MCSFLVIALFLVPVFIFLVALIFALPLYAVECEDDPNLCSYYEWFKYICGNLVGLGTPLSADEYTPASGHVVAELFDLLIAAWSMALAGLIYGLVGALGFVTLATELMDQSLASRIKRFILEKRTRRRIMSLAADSSEMSIDEFLAACSKLAGSSNISENDLRAMFAEQPLVTTVRGLRFQST